MLKQCTAFFLLLAFMASTFSKAVIVIDFYANRAYIAKYLCVNRGSDRQIIDCGGQCHLTKQLSKEAEQDKSNPERRAENKSEVVFFQEFAGLHATPPSALLIVRYPQLVAAAPVDRAIALLRPPGA
jgi:hypothetical protein